MRRKNDRGQTGSEPSARPGGRSSTGASPTGASPTGAAPAAPSPTPLARGRMGEQFAALYLEGEGLRIVDRNRRVGRLEVDLVAESGSELVVVEVRLRSRADHGSPEETVDFRKRARLRTAGRRIWEGHGRDDLALRFDLIAIRVDPEGVRLRHYRAFLDPEGPGTERIRGRF